MQITTISCAREFAEAMLDACEIAEETNGPVAVYFDEDRGIAYASKKVQMDISEIQLCVYPDGMAPTKPDLHLIVG